MTVLYEPWPVTAAELAALLGQAGHAVRTAADPVGLAAILAENPGEPLVVFGPGAAPAEAAAFAAEQRLRGPATGVVLLRADAGADLLREALRAGIREVADPHDPVAVLEACGRSLELSQRLAYGGAPPDLSPGPYGGREAPGGQPGRIVTVLATKGGCGKTTVATNLAVALAAGGRHRVLLVDLDVEFGDVAIALQLTPERGLADAVAMADRLDETGLRSLLTPYRPGLDTLLAPVRPTDGEQVGGPLVGEVLRLARDMFDYVVVDTPPHFSDPALAALDVTDHFLVLAAPDVLTLKNTRIALETLELLGHPAERRIVTLNRSGSPVGLTPQDVERVLRVPPHAHIPSSADVPLSLNRGVPLTADDPAHPVSRAISEIASRYLHAVPAERSRRERGRRGLLRRVRG
ncbi:AAA family ATPase [Planomonospora sp. ID67723]|uniref:AAA family ATPase n=1 Tax=Planomonospora sp. ID67723 TaxID=2738134 RepID=UPI0018C43EDA|nr:AAA family ATPase [Planomonospora sp. ID67723]MBG0833276.1 AAA family ATPase [Planomonospora sp. ID67723]